MHIEEPAGLRHTRESRVSKLIRRGTNLDSRVRENDESRGEHVLRIQTIFMLFRRAQAHGPLRGE